LQCHGEHIGVGFPPDTPALPALILRFTQPERIDTTGARRLASATSDNVEITPSP
jgi:hypothetical protein